MGELFAVLSALGFSLANVMIRKGATRSAQNNGAFLSVLLTLFISGTIVLGRGLFHGWPTINSDGLIWFILAGVLTAFLGRSLLYSSVQHLGSVRATAVKRLNPFFAVILGVLLMGDALTTTLIVGMLLIFFSFSILIYEGYQKNDTVRSNEKNDLPASTTKWNWVQMVKMFANIGYVYGPISALCYALGYVARKQGLVEIPDPFFGTMIGAFVGALVFLAMGLLQEKSRTVIKLTFTRFEPWLLGAGISMSAGQISYFVALSFIEVSRVALLASIEVFITLCLATFVFKTRESLTGMAVVAIMISMIGAALVAIH